MYLHSKICVQMWKSVILTKRAENIRSEAAFFCLKCLIGYTCYGRSGRAVIDWPFLLVRYFHPCSVCHHSVEGMEVGFKLTKRNFSHEKTNSSPCICIYSKFSHHRTHTYLRPCCIRKTFKTKKKSPFISKNI